MQADAHGLKPLCFSSRLGGNLPALFPCLISRFILSLVKEERETGLYLLVQIGSHCSTFDNTELFFFFWRGSAVSEELEEGILRGAN